MASNVAANSAGGGGGGAEQTRLGNTSWDRRVFIRDPRAHNPPHEIQKFIFPLFTRCSNQGCKDKSNHLGTCFILRDLYDTFRSRDYHYFATAFHNLVCDGCGECHSVKISRQWKEGDKKPKAFLVDEYISGTHGAGWIKVPDEFKKNIRDDDRSRYRWDFGVIAVLEKRCDKTISKMIIDSFKSHNGLLIVADHSQDRSQAYLCGYPFSVECESGGDPYADIDVKPVPQKKQLNIMVVGGMIRMSNRNVVIKKGDKQAPPKSGETENERKLRSEHERSTAGLYSLPQSHLDEENENYPTTKVFETTEDGVERGLDEVLYRHYIDSSGGQSGSPVYILGTDITDSITYSTVGIHVGRWDISPMGFNACVRLDAAVQRIKDENWPTWSRDQQNKPVAPMKSGGEGEQGTVIMVISLCVQLM